MEYTDFKIFKNTHKEEGSNQPDYTMQASVKNADGTYTNFTVASLWLKEGKNGKFFSGQMKKGYVNKEGKTVPGYKIVADVAKKVAVNEINAVIDAKEIPF